MEKKEKKEKKTASVRDQRRALSQYKRLLREISTDRQRLRVLTDRLARGVATGLPEFCVFTAEEVEGYRRRIDENRTRCLQLVSLLQQYIYEIDDSETRSLFIWRYIYGYSWQRVAFSMGEYDESKPRKRHNRYLEAHPFTLAPAGDVPSASHLFGIDEALRHAVLENGQ